MLLTGSNQKMALGRSNNFMLLKSPQKLALITGAATRIGSFIARQLANDGWNIALHYYQSQDEAFKLAKELLPLVDVILFKADLSDVGQTITMTDEIKAQMGEISLLINNASLYRNDTLTNLTKEDLENNLNIHLCSPIYLAKAMLESSGNIINIIDTDVCQNMHKFFSYSLAKKAMLNLTQMLALNMAPCIRVNAIAPGPMLFKEGQDIELFNRLVNESPLKLKPSLDELYQTIKFLIHSQNITGQCLFLDSGRHLL